MPPERMDYVELDGDRPSLEAEISLTMRCAEEEGWPERLFHYVPGWNIPPDERGYDYTCSGCGWMQRSLAGGCAELCTSVTWHNREAYRLYAEEATKGGYPVPDDPPCFVP